MKTEARSPHAAAFRARFWPANGRAGLVIALLAFAAMAGITTRRTLNDLMVPGQPQLAMRAGLHDFRDEFYYPSVAVRDRVNPYDGPTYLKTYPVRRTFSPYLPTSLALHYPYVLLPLMPAAWLHYALNLLFLLALAAMILVICRIRPSPAAVLGLGAILLASRPGAMNLHAGGPSAYLVLASLAALHFGSRRPWLAAVALALASNKLPLGIPTGILMLARRQARPAFLGAGLEAAALVLCGLVLVPIAGGMGPLIASYRNTIAHLGLDPPANSVISIQRFDTVALWSHLTGRPPGLMEPLLDLIVIGLGAWGVARLGRLEAEARDPHVREDLHFGGWALACFTILAFAYHLAYDGLMFGMPAVALATGRLFRDRPRLRLALLALIAVPAFNFASSSTVTDRLHLEVGGLAYRLLGSINGFAVLTGWIVLVVVALREPRRSSTAALSPNPVVT